MSKVIKQFAWSPDGRKVERLKAGDERDFGETAASLIADGFVEAPKIDEIDSNGGDTGRQSRFNNSGKRKT